MMNKYLYKYLNYLPINDSCNFTSYTICKFTYLFNYMYYLSRFYFGSSFAKVSLLLKQNPRPYAKGRRGSLFCKSDS